MKRLFRFLFEATNQAIDLSYEGREYGGIQFWVVLKWPLFIRRTRCSHKRARSRELSWCFRCELPIARVGIQSDKAEGITAALRMNSTLMALDIQPLSRAFGSLEQDLFGRALVELEVSLHRKGRENLTCVTCGQVAWKYKFGWLWNGTQLLGPFCSKRCEDKRAKI